MTKDASPEGLDSDQACPEAWVSLDIAAEQIGVSVKTLRRWIQQGRIPSQKVEIPTGFTYRVQVPSRRVQAWTTCLDSDSGHHFHAAPQNVQPIDHAVFEGFRSLIEQLQEEKTHLYQENSEQARQIARLHDERAELYGRLGYFQAQLDATRAQLQAAQTRLLELEAPKETPAGTSNPSNHPASERDAQDSTVQTASEKPTEQSQAEPASESGTTAAANSQDASSGQPFKRLWRWLTRPV